MNKIINLIKYLIGWPLSIISIAFILNVIYSNLPKISNSLVNINISFLLFSIFLFVVYFFFRAYLWKMLLGEKGDKFSFKENALYWSTSELKRYTPGNIWSFISRTALFEKNDLSKKEILVYIAHESIILCLSTLLLSLFYIEGLGQLKYIIYLFALLSTVVFLFPKSIIRITSIIPFSSKILRLLIPQNSFLENLRILSVGLITFFIFGVGNYFSVVSIFYLNPRDLPILLGIFNFSFFIGYISIVTPMGLGVRETTLTLTLSKFLAYSSAAVSSIFTRIIFIISELIALFLVILWYKIKNDLLEKIEEFVIKNKHLILLSIFISCYIFYFTTASFFRYDNFYTGRFDLGNMDQTIWNTIHGRIFQLTNPDGTQTISRLSVHADFILILISPLYLIWSNPKMLLLLQTIVLGIGALFVYLISKEILKNKNISLALSVCYLLNPAVGYVNLYDFHAVALSTTFFLSAFYFLLKKRFVILSLSLFLAGITKEEIWSITSIFGVYIAFKTLIKERVLTKKFFFGLIWTIVGILITYLLISKFIPAARGGNHFALSYYSDFGSSVLDVIKNILLNPLQIIHIIFDKSRFNFLVELFSPLGFLSLLSPVFIAFAAPDFAISLLSNNPNLHEIYYQYTAPMTPFIFIAAIYSIKLLNKKIKFLKLEYFVFYLIFMTLYAAYSIGPLPFSKYANLDMFAKQLKNRNEIHKFLTEIPKKYSIASTNNVGSHLSRRQNIYTIPLGIDKADIIIFLNSKQYYPSADIVGIENNLEQSPEFSTLYKTDGFVAFARKSSIVNLKP